ncbi:potassium channel family protein [Halopenitus persicus]|uniref:Trk system potassium uptake protein TrkA n=1 Tax=Halopenitus persicus TaxID=1048396 RepID=A0A1H3ELX7_9EURY|nr:TrkA family potassium uptake protein [Halopenitus persicus]SDX79610.1 trk system potassium uptake protein TrkA [Halopenitus persicus]
MRILVVGFGRVGARTARVLDAEGHEVTVVDDDHGKVLRARERGFTTIEGDGGDRSVLETGGIDEVAAVGGLTGTVETNHRICRIGSEYGCRTVMRLSEDVDPEVYDRYEADADEVIYPERFGAAGAKTAILGGDFNALGDLTEGLQLIVVRIDADAPVVGDHVNEIDLGDHGRIYAHGRDGDPLTIPLPGTAVETGDRLAILAVTGAIEDVESTLLG